MHLALNEDDPVVSLLAEARRFLADGNTAEAAGVLDPVLALLPLDGNVNALGGIISLMLGRVPEAGQRLAIAFEALDPVPPNVSLYFAAALASLDLGVRAEEVIALRGDQTGVAESLLVVVDTLRRAGHLVQSRHCARFIATIDDPWLSRPDNASTLGFKQIALDDLEGAALTMERHLSGTAASDEKIAIQAGIHALSGNLDAAIKSIATLRRRRPDLADDPRLPVKLHRQCEQSAWDGRDEKDISLGPEHFLQSAPFTGLLDKRGTEVAKWRAASQIAIYHISECGGSSLFRAMDKLNGGRNISCIAWSESDAFQTLSEERRHGYPLVHWHLATPIRPFVSPTAKIVSMVRDPVQRMISEYYWCAKHRGKGNSWVPSLIENGVSFRDWVAWMEEHPRGHLRDWITALRPSHQAPWSLEEILEVTEQEVDFLGITEYFDASLFILGLLIGNGRIPKWERAASASPPKRTDLDPAIIRSLERICELDMAFYEACRQRFLDHYGDMVAYFQEHVGSLELR